MRSQKMRSRFVPPALARNKVISLHVAVSPRMLQYGDFPDQSHGGTDAYVRRAFAWRASPLLCASLCISERISEKKRLDTLDAATSTGRDDSLITFCWNAALATAILQPG